MSSLLLIFYYSRDSCEDVMIQKEGKKKTYNFPLLDFYPTTTTTTTTTKNTTRGNITPDPEQSTPSSGNGTGGGDHHSAAFGNVANNIVLFSIAFVVMVAPLLAWKVGKEERRDFEIENLDYCILLTESLLFLTDTTFLKK